MKQAYNPVDRIKPKSYILRLNKEKKLSSDAASQMKQVSVLPPLSSSWIISIIELYIALNRTPNIDCYWVGAVPK